MWIFSDSVKNNSELILQRVNTKCYKITKELFTSVVNKSPSPGNPGETAKGLLANQWYPKEGGFSEETGTATSPNGASSLARISSLMGKEFYRRDGMISLSNNLYYAYRAEVLGWPKSDGWSGRVGPYRMVALSLQAIAAKYR